MAWWSAPSPFVERLQKFIYLALDKGSVEFMNKFKIDC